MPPGERLDPLFPPPRSTRHWASKGCSASTSGLTGTRPSSRPSSALGCCLLYEDIKAGDPSYAGWER
jgi:hypothetical protein